MDFKLLTDNFKNNIRNFSKKDLTKEACGLFIVSDNIIQLLQTNNISSKPEKHFLISGAEINSIKQKGKILGIWHSHLTGTDGLSVPDQIVAEKLNLHSIVYCVENDAFFEYQPIGLEVPLIGRPFYFGVLDCLTLIVDYYKRTLNIEMQYPYDNPIINIDPGSYITSPLNNIKNSYAKDYLISQNFTEVFSPREHDVLLFTVDDIVCPSHFAVYLKENRLLHQLYNCLSESCSYSKYWKARQKHTMRHKMMVQM